MKIFYSPSLRGFFSPDVHDRMPADAKHRVSPKRHAELLEAQSQGAQIVPGKGGKPELLWPDRSLATKRSAAVRSVKREAQRRIRRISPIWRQLNDLRESTPAGAARFAAIDAIRAASGTIEAEATKLDAAALAQFAVLEHPAWPPEETA